MNDRAAKGLKDKIEKVRIRHDGDMTYKGREDFSAMTLQGGEARGRGKNHKKQDC